MTTELNKKKQFQGVVVSTKMQKTIVVAVKRYVKHPKYKKYLLRTKRFMVHSENPKIKEGDLVTIRETRPLSRHKSFTLAEA